MCIILLYRNGCFNVFYREKEGCYRKLNKFQSEGLSLYITSGVNPACSPNDQTTDF